LLELLCKEEAPLPKSVGWSSAFGSVVVSLLVLSGVVVGVAEVFELVDALRFEVSNDKK
jgi:hypothetical protein